MIRRLPASESSWDDQLDHSPRQVWRWWDPILPKTFPGKRFQHIIRIGHNNHVHPILPYVQALRVLRSSSESPDKLSSAIMSYEKSREGKGYHVDILLMDKIQPRSSQLQPVDMVQKLFISNHFAMPYKVPIWTGEVFTHKPTCQKFSQTALWNNILPTSFHG